MKRFNFEVITKVLVIEAETIEEAELQYDAFWNMDNSCPCSVDYCECVTEYEETYHRVEESEGVSA